MTYREYQERVSALAEQHRRGELSKAEWSKAATNLRDEYAPPPPYDPEIEKVQRILDKMVGQRR